jgi:hypothetical protein
MLTILGASLTSLGQKKYKGYHWTTLPCPCRRYQDYPAPSVHSLCQPAKEHLATVRGVQAMVVRCGLSTSGPWDGPVICNETRLVCDTQQSGDRCNAEMYALFYLFTLFTLFVVTEILHKG